MQRAIHRAVSEREQSQEPPSKPTLALVVLLPLALVASMAMTIGCLCLR